MEITMGVCWWQNKLIYVIALLSFKNVIIFCQFGAGSCVIVCFGTSWFACNSRNDVIWNPNLYRKRVIAITLLYIDCSCVNELVDEVSCQFCSFFGNYSSVKIIKTNENEAGLNRHENNGTLAVNNIEY